MPKPLDIGSASAYGLGMDTHNDPTTNGNTSPTYREIAETYDPHPVQTARRVLANDPWAGGELAAALRRAQDRLVGRQPTGNRPEWVKRAQAGVLVRKDLTGGAA